MSKVIPAQIERDFLDGKARYKTFQTGLGGQTILPVDPNAYIVIFGYDFTPAGGGLSRRYPLADYGTPGDLLPFGSQQLSFYTGNDFYPFIHNVPLRATAYDPEGATAPVAVWTVDNTRIENQTYIIANKDVAITVGLINTVQFISQNAIPVTSRTPRGLTYGGDAQTPFTQTNFSPVTGPIQFMQPSVKDYNDFGFGLIPGNASDQAFAIPDQANGLIEPSQYIYNTLGFGLNAAHYYFLNVHYALYTEATPEQL